MMRSLRQFVPLALLVLAVPFADAQTEPQLIGSWEAVRVLDADGEREPRSSELMIMTFTDDSRLLARLNTSPYNPLNQYESVKASYRVDGAILVLVNEEGYEQRLLYHIEGDELAHTAEDGPDETAYLRRVE